LHSACARVRRGGNDCRGLTLYSLGYNCNVVLERIDEGFVRVV
jgi:hypothetical protein